MTDLQGFFRHLVNTVAHSDPARLRQPLALIDIRNSIVPYRTHRRALQLESSEDYELLIMRLCAGEGGLAHTSPNEVQAAFKAELSGPNPDLSLIEQHATATITLDPAAVTRELNYKPDVVFAPGEARIERGHPVIDPSPFRTPDTQSSAPVAEHARLATCSRCGGALPQHRLVNFCPQCGYNLRLKHCAACNLEVEPGWRHCVGCGAPVTAPS